MNYALKVVESYEFYRSTIVAEVQNETMILPVSRKIVAIHFLKHASWRHTPVSGKNSGLAPESVALRTSQTHRPKVNVKLSLVAACTSK